MQRIGEIVRCQMRKSRRSRERRSCEGSGPFLISLRGKAAPLLTPNKCSTTSLPGSSPRSNRAADSRRDAIHRAAGRPLAHESSRHLLLHQPRRRHPGNHPALMEIPRARPAHHYLRVAIRLAMTLAPISIAITTSEATTGRWTQCAMSILVPMKVSTMARPYLNLLQRKGGAQRGFQAKCRLHYTRVACPRARATCIWI